MTTSASNHCAELLRSLTVTPVNGRRVEVGSSAFSAIRKSGVIPISQKMPRLRPSAQLIPSKTLPSHQPASGAIETAK